jgi:hypothetical protein
VKGAGSGDRRADPVIDAPIGARPGGRGGDGRVDRGIGAWISVIDASDRRIDASDRVIDRSISVIDASNDRRSHTNKSRRRPVFFEHQPF